MPTTQSGVAWSYVNCIYCPAQSGISDVSVPIGSLVHLTWAETHNVNVRFLVYQQWPGGLVYMWDNATAGDLVFLAAGAVYTLSIGEPLGPGPGVPVGFSMIQANWTIQYASPLIWV
ncbi:MAG TPA: hypothetical protein VFG07_09050 [Thermoplasmata archaeon]|nr:hypothetical protein [Thermoplasmata archaeon]